MLRLRDAWRLRWLVGGVGGRLTGAALGKKQAEVVAWWAQWKAQWAATLVKNIDALFTDGRTLYLAGSGEVKRRELLENDMWCDVGEAPPPLSLPMQSPVLNMVFIGPATFKARFTWTLNNYLKVIRRPIRFVALLCVCVMCGCVCCVCCGVFHWLGWPPHGVAGCSPWPRRMHFMPQDTLPDDMLCLPSSVLVWFDVNVIHENQFDGNLYFDTCHKRGVRSIGLVHQSDEKFNTKWKKHHRRPGAYKMYDKVRTTYCRRRGD